MEITNCEQYVLAELDYEQRRNERLAAENNKLAKQLDAMTKRANGYSRIINRQRRAQNRQGGRRRIRHRRGFPAYWTPRVREHHEAP